MGPFNNHLLKEGSTIREALGRFNILAKDAILFIVDANNRLKGSLTDGDVRRGFLKGFGIEDKVEQITQPNPRFIRKGELNLEKVIEYRQNNFRIIPILDSENRVVNVVNFRLLKSYLPIDAVVMAGGRGKRLKPLTDKVPKPLLKVGDKAILEHNLNRLTLFGIDDFWISVNYLGEQIEQKFGDGNDKNILIQYVHEDQPLGTIGAVSKIGNFEHDYVLVTNSDILTNIDYEHFFLYFLKSNADFAVVTIPYNVTIPYAVLETNNDEIVDFVEKPTYTYYSNGGIYLMKKSVLKFIPKDQFFNTTDLMELLISLKMKVVSYPLLGYWLDIGSHEEYQRAQNDIQQIKFD
jgi:dTDP-glucose pyrophosphorylase